MKTLLSAIAVAALLAAGATTADVGSKGKGYGNDRGSYAQKETRGDRYGKRGHRGKGKGYGKPNGGGGPETPETQTADAPEFGGAPERESDDRWSSRRATVGRNIPQDYAAMSMLGSGAIEPEDLVSTCDGGCWEVRPGAHDSWLKWKHVGGYLRGLRNGAASQ